MSDASLDNFDEETRAILMQGMSAAAAQASMGLGGDAELAATRQREQEEFARDMERKNAEAQRRRAELVSGVSSQEPPKSEIEQKPVKKRSRKGMKKQDSPAIPKNEFAKAPEPAHAIAPAQPIPEQPEPPVGFTQADLELINSVKAAQARSRARFLEQGDTVHPYARDARMPQQVTAADAERFRQECQQQPVLDEQVAQQPMPYHPQAVPHSTMGPYGNMISAPVGNMANTQAFLEAARQMPAHVQPMPAPEPPAIQPEPKFEPRVDRAVTDAADVHAVRTFDPSRPDRDFEAFTEIVGWPSKGLFYQDKIYGQALKTIDVFMLSDATADDLDSILTTIIGRRTRGIPPEDILSCDEEYLLYWLRASSFPEDDAGLAKLKFECPHCHRDFRSPEAIQILPGISFNNLSFATDVPPEEVAAMHAEQGFAQITAYDGRECDVYLRRRKHDRIMSEYVEGWENANGEPFPAYKRDSLSIAAVVEIEDCDTMSDKIEFIENCPLGERRKMVKSILDAQLITKTTASVKCPNCGGTAILPYPFRILNYVASL